MKSDIKKKFIDILFEPEEEETPSESRKKTETRKEITEEFAVNAKDILYRKPEKSAFIDLYEKPKEKAKKEESEYEFTSQISPIFGIIRNSDQKAVSTANTDETQIKKPENTHLDIITSPIYGYGSKEEAERAGFSVGSYDEDDELHRLLDEAESYHNHTYDDFDGDDINLFDAFGEEE